MTTFYKKINPTSNENISSGYELNDEWLNVITSSRYKQKTDGIWSWVENTNGDLIMSNEIPENSNDELPNTIAGALLATTQANTAASNYAQSIRTVVLSSFDIQMSDSNGICNGEEFTKLTGMSSLTTFTISNPIIKKDFRLVMSGGALSVPTFAGYTVTWLYNSLVSDYNPAITNYLWCEIRSAGKIYCFWGQ